MEHAGQHQQKKPRQFSLRALFLVVSLAAVLSAVVATIMREPTWKVQWRIKDAATYGDLETVKELVERLGDPNGRTVDGDTAVHAAARRGHTHVVGYLLGRGANVDIRDIDHQETPLHSAVRNNQLGMVRYLLKMGAETNVRDSRGRTARDWAVVFNHKDAIEIFDRTK